MKYYYSDPLAAAWMAKHFDMWLFLGTYPDDFDSYRFRNWQHCQDDWVYRQERLGQAAPRFYIHADSLNLLEPLEGDLVEDGDMEYEVVWRDHQGLRVDTSKGTIMPTGLRIIQRDGKPFFWPECEEKEEQIP